MCLTLFICLNKIIFVTILPICCPIPRIPLHLLCTKNLYIFLSIHSITAHLHFADNLADRPEEDRLYKLRPVVDCLSKQFAEVFTPGQKVCVDESLWRFKGRHHAIQFIPSKRARFGLKVYKLCPSVGQAAGYTCSFRVYMGQDRGEVLASQRAVVDLMERADLFGKGYELYCDNWYTSPLLFHYLQSRGTNAVGTVRTTRKFMPRDLKVSKKGEWVRRSTNTGVLALAWMDKKQVTVLSTVHRGSSEEMITLPPNRSGDVRIKPQAVLDYNIGKLGVDLSDQLGVSYQTPRKCRKWYHNLFFHLVDMAVVNAWKLHRYLGGSLDHREFGLKLVDSLTPLPTPRRQMPAGAAPPRRRGTGLPEGHLLVRTPRYRRCKHCRETRCIRKDVQWECAVCKVGLCAGECFNAYSHTPRA